jgi:hypothetical protein
VPEIAAISHGSLRIHDDSLASARSLQRYAYLRREIVGSVSSFAEDVRAGGSRLSNTAMRWSPVSEGGSWHRSRRMPSAALYDRIGIGYPATRGEEPRIARAIREALGDARKVRNMGPGTGSCQPRVRRLVRNI